MALSESQQALADAMSDTSELCYCARWMSMTEYRLWRFMSDPSDDGDWGNVPIPEETRGDLRELSQKAGGWIYWRDSADIPPEDHGPVFIATAEWLKVYETWRQDQWLPP